LAEMVSRIATQNQRLSLVLAEMADENPASRDSVRNEILQELENERSRIAKALHAGAGQPLAGIKLNLDILDECPDLVCSPARQAMERLRVLTDSALTEVRAVSHRLHPPDWQALSTAEALRYLLSDIGAESYFSETRFDVRSLPVEPEHNSKICLYRCAQECIANVIRHSGATKLEVSLIPLHKSVELRVADNGKGIKNQQPSSVGLGLRAIRQHVAAAEGACKIESSGEGTVIIITIPLASEF
jgi:two-component system, NarL family, sensor kinase